MTQSTARALILAGLAALFTMPFISAPAAARAMKTIDAIIARQAMEAVDSIDALALAAIAWAESGG
jgi:hypothetical protein